MFSGRFPGKRTTHRCFKFIESYKSGNAVEEIAAQHFRSIWDQFPNIIKTFLPTAGAPETHIIKFLENGDIREIPEFHILATVLYPMVKAYGIDQIEHGLQDEEILAAESIAIYLPHYHYYVTKVDIAEILTKSDVQETYHVRVYGHNESSLYRLIEGLTEDCKNEVSRKEYQSRKTIFQKGGTKR
jgi:hypothetical protein